MIKNNFIVYSFQKATKYIAIRKILTFSLILSLLLKTFENFKSKNNLKKSGKFESKKKEITPSVIY